MVQSRHDSIAALIQRISWRPTSLDSPTDVVGKFGVKVKIMVMVMVRVRVRVRVTVGVRSRVRVRVRVRI